MMILHALSLALSGYLSGWVSPQPFLQQGKATPTHGVVGVTLGSGASGYQAGSPWPRFRHDNLGTSVSAYAGCNALDRWKVNLGSPVFLSSPAIAADGTVYVGTESGELFAVDTTGAIKWNYQTNGPIWSSPAIGIDGTVYIGSDDFSMYAVSPTGSKVWSFQTGDQVDSSPAIDPNGNIYFGSWDKNLYAVTKDGKLKWRFPTGGAVQSSPVIGADGTIYVGSDDHFLYAVNPNGTQKWSFQTKGPIQSSPGIGSDGTIYIGSCATVGDFYAISPSGTKTWEYDCRTLSQRGGPITASPAVGLDGSIYIASDNIIFSLSSSGSLNWNWGPGLMRGSPAIDVWTYIFITENNGLMQMARSGNGGSNGYAQNFVMSSPAIGVDGEIYFGGGDGYLYAVGSEVHTVPLSSVTVSPTAVTGGMSSTGTVTLTNQPPGVTGDVVAVTSSSPVATLVSPVYIDWASISNTFTIKTVPVTVDTPVTITAVSGGVTKTTILTVKAPVPASLALNPTSVTGSSNTTVTATVTLSGVAPPGGVVVSLSSSNTAAATVPSTLSIPAGASVGTFTVSHSKIAAQANVTITATLNGTSATANLTVLPG